MYLIFNGMTYAKNDLLNKDKCHFVPIIFKNVNFLNYEQISLHFNQYMCHF